MLTDTDLMPFGKYKGERMIDVPDDYLIFLMKDDLKPGDVRTYIENNVLDDVLKVKGERIQKKFREMGSIKPAGCYMHARVKSDKPKN